MKQFLSVLSIALAVAIFVSCNSNKKTEKKLIGTWDVESIECVEDGKPAGIYGVFVRGLSFKNDRVVKVLSATLSPAKEYYSTPEEAWYVDTFDMELDMFYIENGKIIIENGKINTSYFFSFELKNGKLIFINDETESGRNRQTTITYKKIKEDIETLMPEHY